MGRLPVQGVAWYRKKIDIPVTDNGRRICLGHRWRDVLRNGLVEWSPRWRLALRLQFVSTRPDTLCSIWSCQPVGHQSRQSHPFRTLVSRCRFVQECMAGENECGRILHNGAASLQQRISVAAAATVDIAVQIENRTSKHEKIEINTDIFIAGKNGKKIASTGISVLTISCKYKEQSGGQHYGERSRTVGPPPAQKPAMYLAVTSLYNNGKLVDRYETTFGIRDIQFDPEKGIIVNGMPRAYPGR